MRCEPYLYRRSAKCFMRRLQRMSPQSGTCTGFQLLHAKAQSAVGKAFLHSGGIARARLAIKVLHNFHHLHILPKISHLLVTKQVDDIGLVLRCFRQQIACHVYTPFTCTSADSMKPSHPHCLHMILILSSDVCLPMRLLELGKQSHELHSELDMLLPYEIINILTLSSEESQDTERRI